MLARARYVHRLGDVSFAAVAVLAWLPRRLCDGATASDSGSAALAAAPVTSAALSLLQRPLSFSVEIVHSNFGLGSGVAGWHLPDDLLDHLLYDFDLFHFFH